MTKNIHLDFPQEPPVILSYCWVYGIKITISAIRLTMVLKEYQAIPMDRMRSLSQRNLVTLQEGIAGLTDIKIQSQESRTKTKDKRTKNKDNLSFVGNRTIFPVFLPSGKSKQKQKEG